MNNGVKRYASEEYVDNAIANGGGGVQADWNQNDETAVDYIKNRTHKEIIKYDSGYVAATEKNTVYPIFKFDEVTEYSTNTLRTYLAANKVLETNDGVTHSSYAIRLTGRLNGSKLNPSVTNTLKMIDGTNYYLNASNRYWYVILDSTLLSEEDLTRFPVDGVYCEDKGTSSYVTEFCVTFNNNYSLHPYYIPDSIARTKDVILTTEQSLTDEQRAQARKNIAEYQFDWKEVVGYGSTYTLADYGTYVNGQTTMDFDGVLNLTSTVLTQYSALGCLHGCVKSLYKSRIIESVVTTWMPRIIQDFEVIKNAGLLTYNSLVICEKYDDIQLDIAYAINISVPSGYTHGVYFYGDKRYEIGTIYYNIDTNDYKVTMSLDRYRYVDDTLTCNDYAADAKAVGDALAELETKSLPTVTSDDNGKILQVINGIWTAVSLASDLETVTDGNEVAY